MQLGFTVQSQQHSISPNTVKNILAMTGKGTVLRWMEDAARYYPSASQPDFADLDTTIAACEQAGLPVCLPLHNFASSMTTQGTGNCSGKNYVNPEAAGQLAGVLAARYKGKPVWYESLNEGASDGNAECCLAYNPVPLMRAVYQAIKAVDSSILVGGPALLKLDQGLNWIRQWTTNLFANGGGKVVDYLALHYYPGDNTSLPSLHAIWQTMQEVAVQAGFPDMKLRITEYGFPRNKLSAQQQHDLTMAVLSEVQQSGGFISDAYYYTAASNDGYSPYDQAQQYPLYSGFQQFVQGQQPQPSQKGGNDVVTLNSKGEVADFLDESQFIGGHSAYECVAYCASLCKFAGKPGTGPVGSVLASSNLAQYWYGREEGSNLASNTNGMSLSAEYDMLNGISLPYHPLPITGDNTHDIGYVKAWLKFGFPVMICGHENSFFDLDLGDKIPYSWTPTGNHCLVASGIASDGNLLVHDTASIAPSGVRPGPRRYDASKMVLISGTAIAEPWLAPVASDFDPTKEETVTINLTTPGVSRFFEAVPGNSQQWRCIQNGHIIQYGILQAYQSYGNSGECGLTFLGLPLSNEITIDAVKYPGVIKQYFERGCLLYDPSHLIDSAPGGGGVYAAHVYDGGPGTDPALTELQGVYAQIYAAYQQLKAQQGNPQALSAVQQIKQIVSAF